MDNNYINLLTVTGNVSISGTNCKDSGGSATCNNFVDIAELFPSSGSGRHSPIIGVAMQSQKESEDKIMVMVK